MFRSQAQTLQRVCLSRGLAASLALSAALACPKPLQASEANKALEEARQAQQPGLGSPSAFFFRAEPGMATSKAIYENHYEHLKSSTDHPEMEYLLTGEVLKPGILVHHNKVGLGLFGHLGTHKIKNRAEGREVRSTVRHRGLGIELTYLPGSGKHRPLGFYLRAQGVHVDHDIQFDSTLDLNEALPSQSRKKNYLVFTREIGVHYKLNWADTLYLFPWASYQARSIDSDLMDTSSPTTLTRADAQSLDEDADSLWRLDPQVRYGVDVALRVYAFDLHVGHGLQRVMDLVSGSEKGRNTYRNQGYSLSLSYTSRTP